MRGEKEMFELILDFARRDARIRAVILNGSRADPHAVRDEFQDFDVVYFVDRQETFIENREWLDRFGERVIMQTPDAMRLPDFEPDPERAAFAFLMLLTDGNRIDLTLFPVDKIKTHYAADSLSVLLLDKDGIFGALPAASDADYRIKKPSEREFRDVCNEFWWVLPYVAKGLRRGEIVSAKDFLENTVRRMLLKMIEWRIGVETDFAANFGKSGKFLKRRAAPEFYARIIATYADAKPENIWNSVFLMAEIFEESARFVAARLEFAENAEESGRVLKHLEKIKK